MDNDIDQNNNQIENDNDRLKMNMILENVPKQIELLNMNDDNNGYIEANNTTNKQGNPNMISGEVEQTNGMAENEPNSVNKIKKDGGYTSSNSNRMGVNNYESQRTISDNKSQEKLIMKENKF